MADALGGGADEVSADLLKYLEERANRTVKRYSSPAQDLDYAPNTLHGRRASSPMVSNPNSVLSKANSKLTPSAPTSTRKASQLDTLRSIYRPESAASRTAKCKISSQNLRPRSASSALEKDPAARKREKSLGGKLEPEPEPSGITGGLGEAHTLDTGAMSATNAQSGKLGKRSTISDLIARFRTAPPRPPSERPAHDLGGGIWWRQRVNTLGDKHPSAQAPVRCSQRDSLTDIDSHSDTPPAAQRFDCVEPASNHPILDSIQHSRDGFIIAPSSRSSLQHVSQSGSLSSASLSESEWQAPRAHAPEPRQAPRDGAETPHGGWLAPRAGADASHSSTSSVLGVLTCSTPLQSVASSLQSLDHRASVVLRRVDPPERRAQVAEGTLEEAEDLLEKWRKGRQLRAASSAPGTRRRDSVSPIGRQDTATPLGRPDTAAPTDAGPAVKVTTIESCYTDTVSRIRKRLGMDPTEAGIDPTQITATDRHALPRTCRIGMDPSDPAPTDPATDKRRDKYADRLRQLTIRGVDSAASDESQSLHSHASSPRSSSPADRSSAPTMPHSRAKESEGAASHVGESSFRVAVKDEDIPVLSAAPTSRGRAAKPSLNLQQQHAPRESSISESGVLQLRLDPIRIESDVADDVTQRTYGGGDPVGQSVSSTSAVHTAPQSPALPNAGPLHHSGRSTAQGECNLVEGLHAPILPRSPSSPLSSPSPPPSLHHDANKACISPPPASSRQKEAKGRDWTGTLQTALERTVDRFLFSDSNAEGWLSSFFVCQTLNGLAGRQADLCTGISSSVPESSGSGQAHGRPSRDTAAARENVQLSSEECFPDAVLLAEQACSHAAGEDEREHLLSHVCSTAPESVLPPQCSQLQSPAPIATLLECEDDDEDDHIVRMLKQRMQMVGINIASSCAPGRPHNIFACLFTGIRHYPSIAIHLISSLPLAIQLFCFHSTSHGLTQISVPQLSSEIQKLPTGRD